MPVGVWKAGSNLSATSCAFSLYIESPVLKSIYIYMYTLYMKKELEYDMKMCACVYLQGVKC